MRSEQLLAKINPWDQDPCVQTALARPGLGVIVIHSGQSEEAAEI